jgi:hypothetical protein
MYIALLMFELYISIRMTATVTMESITRQNELEHPRPLHEKLRQELGATVCELLDKSTKPTSRVTDIHVNADGAVWVQAGGEYSQVGAIGYSPAR